MGVGGDVVRLLFKVPNGDLTEAYWVNEGAREQSPSALCLFISVPVTLRFIQDTPSLGNIILFLDKHLKVWLWETESEQMSLTEKCDV